MKRSLIIVFSFFLLSFPSGGFSFSTSAKQVILMDSFTGAVLYEKNADERMYPSSMTKLMTVYIVFEQLKSGVLTLDSKFLVSKKAWKKGGSKMFVAVNSEVRVGDLLQGIIVQSGNDACIVVAENIAGDEDSFAEKMTAKAKELGMQNTQFKNSSGWPDPEHYTTARDLAILSKAIIDDFPELYQYFKEDVYTYNGIKQYNRNPLLGRVKGADGLKTGHTEDAGYGLTGSAIRGDQRLVLVANGIDSNKARASETRRIIEWGFREFKNKKLMAKDTHVAQLKLWGGKEEFLSVVSQQDIFMTLKKSEVDKVNLKVVYEGPKEAPVKKGDILAYLVVETPTISGVKYPLIAARDIEKASFVGRYWDAFWGSVQSLWSTPEERLVILPEETK